MTPSDIASFDRRDFAPEVVAAAKGDLTVSVCLPARDEEATVGLVVGAVLDLGRRWDVVDEVLVVDDGSVDATAAVARAAGASVVAAADVLPESVPGTGKGEALWKAVAAAKGDVLVFCDADIRGFDPAFVTGLLGPLVTSLHVDFVKGAYRRSLDGVPGEGGRVTELVARPLIELLFPDLAGFRQPLAGEFAARRDVLERVPFAPGYGVDLGLLVDVSRLVGVGRMAQVDLGERVHRNRPLADLAPQAKAVAAVALRRAGMGPAPAGPALLDGERPPIASLGLARRP